jgi:transposase
MIFPKIFGQFSLCLRMARYCFHIEASKEGKIVARVGQANWLAAIRAAASDRPSYRISHPGLTSTKLRP